MVYRYCIVPDCKSTTVSTPEKTFIKLPIKETQRNIWLKAMRRPPKDISLKSHVYLCEDHFNLEQDMENYMEWKMMGVQKRMKKDVVPHIFACQEDGKRTCPQPEQMAIVKRARQSINQDVLCEASTLRSDLPTQQEISPEIELSCIEDIVKRARQSIIPGIMQDVLCKASTSRSALPTQQVSPPEPKLSCIQENVGRQRIVGVQINLQNKYRSIRSRSIQSNSHSTTLCKGSSPISHPATSVALSPIKLQSVKMQIYSSSESSALEFKVCTSSNSSVSSDSELDEVINKGIKKSVLKFTFQKIKANPRLFLGVMSETFFIIDFIQENLKVDVNNIYLVLQKIRLDKTFQELADDFGVSESSASRIFAKTVGLISNTLKDLIGWFPVEKVKQFLPVPFQTSYCNVYVIIDCLEIEIQKPEDPVKQTLTWSECKKANTIKYLISVTPDGLINFISNGLGGRASDALIVEKSGFLEKLEPNMHIIADRGFKHIDNMLAERNCKLVRPPNVESVSKLNKQEALETNKIASLRIHIERVKRHLREFRMLRPNACIHVKSISQLDYIINIACALVNTQGP